MSLTVTACLSCGRAMISQYTLGRNPQLRGRYQAHVGRGLCAMCRNRHLLNDTLVDFERHNWDADDLLDEWVVLRDEGYTVRAAAPRLGVSFAALDRALCRAKRRGDARGVRASFGRAIA